MKSESSESPQRREELRRPKCYRCGNKPMDEAILWIHYPRATLPVKGYKCRQCGEEVLDAEEAMRHQKLAEKLGLYGDEGLALTRNITKSGKQLAVYIPKEIERELNLESGRKVRIYLRGEEIVIAPI